MLINVGTTRRNWWERWLVQMPAWDGGSLSKALVARSSSSLRFCYSISRLILFQLIFGYQPQGSYFFMWYLHTCIGLQSCWDWKVDLSQIFPCGFWEKLVELEIFFCEKFLFYLVETTYFPSGSRSSMWDVSPKSEGGCLSSGPKPPWYASIIGSKRGAKTK